MYLFFRSFSEFVTRGSSQRLSAKHHGALDGKEDALCLPSWLLSHLKGEAGVFHQSILEPAYLPGTAYTPQAELARR